jgi:hypothetical protein
VDENVRLTASIGVIMKITRQFGCATLASIAFKPGTLSCPMPRHRHRAALQVIAISTGTLGSRTASRYGGHGLLSFLNVSEVFKHVSEKLLLDRIQIQIVQVQGLGRMEE